MRFWWSLNGVSSASLLHMLYVPCCVSIPREQLRPSCSSSEPCRVSSRGDSWADGQLVVPCPVPPSSGECYSGDENVGNSISCPFGSYRDPRPPHSCRACPCGHGQSCSVLPGQEEVVCDHCPPGAAGKAQVVSAISPSPGVLMCLMWVLAAWDAWGWGGDNVFSPRLPHLCTLACNRVFQQSTGTHRAVQTCMPCPGNACNTCIHLLIQPFGKAVMQTD